VLHSPGNFSVGLVTNSGPSIHWTLLQQTFLWGYLKAQVFTHTHPDINSLKKANWQEIADVTQDPITVLHTFLTQSICMKPNFQALLWVEFSGFVNGEL
jgi:hypothetical protein